MLNQTEVIPVTLPSFRELSMKNILKKALLSEHVMRYLPDKEELKPSKISKDFLCTIINTVDQDFFPQCIDKIE